MQKYSKIYHKNYYQENFINEHLNLAFSYLLNEFLEIYKNFFLQDTI